MVTITNTITNKGARGHCYKKFVVLLFSSLARTLQTTRYIASVWNWLPASCSIPDTFQTFRFEIHDIGSKDF